MKTKSFILQNLYHFIDKAKVGAIGYSTETFDFSNDELEYVTQPFFDFMYRISAFKSQTFHDKVVEKLRGLLVEIYENQYLLPVGFKSDFEVMESEASEWLKSQRV
jgi:hypothetical protein